MSAAQQLISLGESVSSQIEALMKQLQEQVAPIITKMIEDAEYITDVRWAQYTPYFNDGEPCEFRIGEFYAAVELEGLSEDGGDYEDGRYTSWDLTYEFDDKPPTEWPENLSAAKQELEEILGAIATIPTDAFLAIWGDHVQVTVSADGIEVEDYEHD